MKYVDIVIDNKSKQTNTFYTYISPFDDIKIGNKVNVSFGRGKILKTGYVVNVFDKLQTDIDGIKKIDSIDKEVSLNEEMIQTAIHIANKYFSRYIDAIKLFLPAGQKAKRRKKKNSIDKVVLDRQNIKKLTLEQRQVLDNIDFCSDIDKKYLLYGITGSGKTEIYMQTAEKVLEKKKKVIIIVPEITMVQQIAGRFKARFENNTMAIMHSGLTLGERYDEWQKIRKGKADIIVGTRIAIFAPVENIGLIVVDEEHDQSYRSDKTPKIDARDIASMRAGYYNSIVVFGSATPSIDSIYNVQKGNYKMLSMLHKSNGNVISNIEVVDMVHELKSGNRSVFSKNLYDAICQSLYENKQVLLLVNRKGYARTTVCNNCGFVVKCNKCDLPMVYYKTKGVLKCNYCGREIEAPKICPQCGKQEISSYGIGIDKVLEETKQRFIDANIVKLDTEVAKVKADADKVLENFKNGKIDILIGTQLVSKGMDVKNLALVGIVDIDQMLTLPDFRSDELAFQLILQVAGRTGRALEPGRVILQTKNPHHNIIELAKTNDITNFYNNELRKRKIFNYPPYGNFILIKLITDTKQSYQSFLTNYVNSISNIIEKDNIISKKFKIDKEQNKYYYYIHIRYANEHEKALRKLIYEKEEYIVKERLKINQIIDINPHNVWRT